MLHTPTHRTSSTQSHNLPVSHSKATTVLAPLIRPHNIWCKECSGCELMTRAHRTERTSNGPHQNQVEHVCISDSLSYQPPALATRGSGARALPTSQRSFAAESHQCGRRSQALRTSDIPSYLPRGCRSWLRRDYRRGCRQTLQRCHCPAHGGRGCYQGCGGGDGDGGNRSVPTVRRRGSLYTDGH